MTNQPSEFPGACHCRAITFSVKGPISTAVRCTCSFCSAIGALWHTTNDAGLTLASGEDALQMYQFGTMTAKHYFCRHCGVHPFSRPRLNPEIWVVNLHCVPIVDLEPSSISIFDGAHWDEAVRALSSLKGMRARR
ncbi:MAG: GFA family protein [Rhodanobacter lindaniclasticus]|jgi:hypothetical protein